MKDESTFSNMALAHNLIILFEDINEMIFREARNKGFGANYSREQRDGFFLSFCGLSFILWQFLLFSEEERSH